MKRIGVDVDGVLACFNQGFVQLFREITGRDLFPAPPAGSDWDESWIPCWGYPEHFGYSTEEVGKVWKYIKASSNFWLNLAPYPGIDDVMDYLKRQLMNHHLVYFITDRPGVSSKWQTEVWLCRWIMFPTVIISRKGKGICAQALDLTDYIDDKWENCLDVAITGTRTALLTRPWNQHEEVPRLDVPVALRRVDTLVGFAD